MKKIVNYGFAMTVVISALTLSACSSEGSVYPSDRFELVIPYGAGGATDTAGRVLAGELKEITGQQVTVVNRPGGGAAVGLTEATSAEPDGYHMVLAPGSAFATLPLLQEVQFGPDDFRSVGGLYDQPYVIVTSKDSPIQSLEDLAGTTGRVTYTTFALGHVAHLSMANVLEEMGVEGEAVPYDSASESIQAVTSGQVDIGVIDMNIAAGQLASGTVTGIALNSDEPHPAFPEIPTFVQGGYPQGAGFLSRISIAVPADTPDDVARELEQLLQQAFDSDKYQKYMEDNYLLAPEYTGSTFFDEYIPMEKERAESSFARLGIEQSNG